MEGDEPLLQRLLGVVLPLDQRLAGEVVEAGRLGRRELLVVRSARSGVHKPAANALDQNLVRHLELDHGVDLAGALRHQHLVKLLRLRHRTWEAVENKTAAALRRADVVLDDADHDLIRDKPPSFHHRLRLLPHLGACSDGRTQQVSRREVAQGVFFFDHWRLRALAAAGWAHEDDVFPRRRLQPPLDLCKQVDRGDALQRLHGGR
mmetsp:Transcript_22516/g.51880  ORF Transcript_22516/g.51880 Transcript_22516/m.51880 type:complete len:206 (+) Transcript_22516:668-1285(+)